MGPNRAALIGLGGLLVMPAPVLAQSPIPNDPFLSVPAPPARPRPAPPPAPTPAVASSPLAELAAALNAVGTFTAESSRDLAGRRTTTTVRHELTATVAGNGVRIAMRLTETRSTEAPFTIANTFVLVPGAFRTHVWPHSAFTSVSNAEVDGYVGTARLTLTCTDNRACLSIQRVQSGNILPVNRTLTVQEFEIRLANDAGARRVAALVGPSR